MFIRKLRNILLLAALLAAGNAHGQQLTEHQLLGTLEQATEAAPAIDPALLIEEVTANVGNGVASLPNWSQLARHPQFIVEINFELNSVAMVPESYRTIGLIADALHHPRLLGYKFLIVGHTDSTGDAGHNLKLSAERAAAIQEALATTFAITPNRLFAVGVGEEMPLDAANPKAAVNRRVQLINIGRVQ